MNLGQILRRTEKLASDNSPLLLTAIGVAGVVGTAILTHKATRKAHAKAEDFIIDLQTAAGPGERIRATQKEIIQATWTCYIPPVVSGTLTIGAIVFANRIGTKRAAALAAAYTVSEQAFTEYKEQVTKRLGVQKEQEIHDDMARDWVKKNPRSESNVVIVGKGETLCCDLYSGRYFRSSPEAINRAVNDVNQQVLIDGYASLSDFYHRLGLVPNDMSEEVGWTPDKLLSVTFSGVLDEESEPCLAFRLDVRPIRDFDRMSGHRP